MRYSLAILAAAVTVVSAQTDNPCLSAYNACVAAGTQDVICRCNLETCSGEDNERSRAQCSSATANLPATTASFTSTSAPATTSAPYACNPAHSYPDGAKCISTDGTLSLVPAATSATFACNPAHSYPDGAQCVSTSGTLALIPAATATPTPGTGAQPAPNPPVNAADGSVQLGGVCSNSKQCANGAECFGSNMMIQLRCGNFNAACDKDSQCAYNTCNHGLCNGFLANATAPATGGAAAATGAGAHPGSPSSAVPYTGGASIVGALSGVAALVAGAAAWVL